MTLSNYKGDPRTHLSSVRHPLAVAREEGELYEGGHNIGLCPPHLATLPTL